MSVIKIQPGFGVTVSPDFMARRSNLALPKVHPPLMNLPGLTISDCKNQLVKYFLSELPYLFYGLLLHSVAGLSATPAKSQLQ